jgi:thioesterase domain-containing protein
MQQTYQLTPQDRVLQKTPFSFDVSVWEFFWPLIAGAHLIVATPDGHRDSSYLKTLIAEQSVTTLHFVPSMLQAFLAETDLQSCDSLRQVISSGEALDARLSARFFAQAGESAQLHNLYGPTEAAIDVTFWPCQCDCSDDDPQVPIGYPIANTQIYVLDSHLQPVPIGVTGELYIGGVALARGYVNRPDLTAERFIPHPYPMREGERLYHTGDLARYRADGALEYLGRTDHQVQLRGHRIELGEIETALRAYPAIEDCVVLLREDEAGDKRLVAYPVVQQGQRLTISELRSYLQDRLPLYMIPSNFVLLAALPRLSNGKVDRRALVLTQDMGLTESRTVVAPRTPVEIALATIWTDLLRLEQVSVSDNFFELGGHSLLAAQLLNRINQQFGTALSLPTLFRIPTIAQVAALLQTEMKELNGRASVLVPSLCVPIQPTGENPPFFCVHPAPGVVSCFLDLAKHLRHDRPFYGIQAPGLDVDDALFSSIEEMAAAYVDALLALQPSDTPYFLGGYSFGGLVAFEMARQLEAQGCRVALLALLDSYPLEQDASAETAGTHDDAQLIVELVEVLGRYGRTNIVASYEDVRRLQADEQLAYLLDRLREAKVAPDNTSISEVRRLLQVSKAHQFCGRRYRPKLYAGRITLLRSGNAEVDPSSWAPFSSEPVEVHSVSGDHLSMVAEPYVQSLAVQLQQCLDQADQEPRKGKQPS